jgi:hypothetical protein
MQTDEQRWLDNITQHEPKEVGRAEVATQTGPLMVRRVEVGGSPEFTLGFGEPAVEVKLLPGQVYRLVQMLIALADLAPAERKG